MSKERQQNLFQVLGKREEARPGLIKRLIPSWVMRVPAAVGPEQSKIYFTRLAVPMLGAFCHSMLLIVYLLFDVPSMVIVNLVSVGIFIVAALLVWSGRHYQGANLSIIEASI